MHLANIFRLQRSSVANETRDSTRRAIEESWGSKKQQVKMCTIKWVHTLVSGYKWQTDKCYNFAHITQIVDLKFVADLQMLYHRNL